MPLLFFQLWIKSYLAVLYGFSNFWLRQYHLL